MTDNNYAPLQLYTMKELAALYGIDRKTLYRWLKPHKALIGLKPRHRPNILQVKIVFRLFGRPLAMHR